MPIHKFHLGQPVEFNPPRGIYAPRGPYVVTAKLPERDGVFEYRIRSAVESHERLARENELSVVIIEEPRDIKKHPTGNLKRKAAPPSLGDGQRLNYRD